MTECDFLFVPKVSELAQADFRLLYRLCDDPPRNRFSGQFPEPEERLSRCDVMDLCTTSGLAHVISKPKARQTQQSKAARLAAKIMASFTDIFAAYAVCSRTMYHRSKRRGLGSPPTGTVLLRALWGVGPHA